MTYSKYHADPTWVNGIRFPSKLEAQVYADLLTLKKQGVILYFLRQVPFDLGGGVTYRADFLVFYRWPTPKRGYFPFVLEAKGMETEAYKIKRKLMVEKHPRFTIVETKGQSILSSNWVQRLVEKQKVEK